MCVRTPPACCISSRAIQFWGRDHEHLEGDPVPPKLFLAPAKDGGAPPRNGSVDGAVWQGRAAATPTQQRSNDSWLRRLPHADVHRKSS
jgi:hypothetical protein